MSKYFAKKTSRPILKSVIPAKAGIQWCCSSGALPGLSADKPGCGARAPEGTFTSETRC